MKFEPKALSGQVIVITGASSGIGLATAKMAAGKGAKVVLASRNENELNKIVQALNKHGFRATHLALDVAKKDQVDRLAKHAISTFGRIDTWVNDAAAALYGELTEVPIEDHRQMFEVNYWGVVNGSLAAVEAMRKGGGTLINIGSILSDIPIPLQGHYVATKHAVKGFTETLALELAHGGVPVNVTLIKPAAIDTPYPDHARAYMREAPTLPPPHYAPEVVARAILHAATHPVRELYVGGAGRLMVASRALSPMLFDLAASMMGYFPQKSSKPEASPASRDNLYAARQDGSTRGLTWQGHPREASLYTELQMRPALKTMLVAAAGIGVVMLLNKADRRS